MDPPFPDLKENHSPSPERKFPVTQRHYPALPGTWYFHFRHALHGKYPLHQFHLQPFKVRWRPGSRSNDHHYQCVSQLVTMPVQGICQGGQPIISYNFGANNKKRVKEAFLPSLKPASFLRPCAGLFCFLHACEN